MKYLIVSIFFFHLSCKSFSQDTTRIICKIEGEIPIIKQPKSIDCWITVATMLLSWKDKKLYTIDEIIQKLGEPWRTYYHLNSGLSEIEQPNFVKKIGLIGEPPANHTIDVYFDFIKKYGPIWITSGDEWTAHARILIGAEGGGNYQNTTFILIDPQYGKIVKQPILKFLQEYEDLARAYQLNRHNKEWKNKNIRMQIYHF